MDVIDRNITAQTQLVEDLLDVSRMVTGSMRLHVEPVDLADVVRAVVESIAPAAAARRIAVTTTCDVGPGPVDGDPARLSRSSGTCCRTRSSSRRLEAAFASV